MFQDWLSDRASKDTGTRLAVKVQFGLEPWKGYGDWIRVTYIGGIPMVDRERGGLGVGPTPHKKSTASH